MVEQHRAKAGELEPLIECIMVPRMKPAPPPEVPGNTPWERFDNVFRTILTVSKEDLVKAEAKWKREREKKKRARKSAG